jgi:inner membrane protein
VDPVSHLLFGRAVALTVRRPRWLTGITAALVLGSIVPDVDAVIAPWRFDLYLRAHASGTHSLLGAIVESVVLTLWLRRVLSESRTLPLFLASLGGALGHIFWDLADGSDIRVLEPFSEALAGWHLVSMGEPIVLIVLVAAVLAAWRWPASARMIAATGLVLLGAFLGFKKMTQGQALARYTAATAAEAVRSTAIAPELGSLFVWNVYDRAGDRVRGWKADARSGRIALAFEYRDEAATAAASASRALPVVRVFLGISRIPFARIERAGGKRLVLWSDATSCSTRGCDISFGGVIDDALVPLYQVIRIGGYTQERALPVAR